MMALGLSSQVIWVCVRLMHATHACTLAAIPTVTATEAAARATGSTAAGSSSCDCPPALSKESQPVATLEHRIVGHTRTKPADMEDHGLKPLICQRTQGSGKAPIAGDQDHEVVCSLSAEEGLAELL